MRIYELLHGLVSKFVPMDKLSADNLQTETLRWYSTQTEELAKLKADTLAAAEYNERHKDKEDFVPQTAPKETLKNKIFKVLESPVARYAFAIAFIFLVPKLKAIINGVSNKAVDPEEEEEEDDFDDYLAWKRHKKQML